MHLTTLTITYIKKFYKKIIALFKRKEQYMQVKVPKACISRRDKNNLIFTTINFLEHNIKIEDYEW